MNYPFPRSLLAVLIAVTAALPASAQDDTRTKRVTFAAGKTEAVLTDKITGRESVVYKINARKDQFLQVSLTADNTATYFNLYIPGRGPGDEALYASAQGDNNYTGQLYKTGDHSISVFLFRAAARGGETSKFEIRFRVTDQQPGVATPLPAEPPAESGLEAAWRRVPFAKREHGPLLERQGDLPESLARNPVAVATAVLGPDLAGVITSVSTSYDSMEGPAEVQVTVTEGGILDDDLLGVRHVLSLAKNRNNQWRIVGHTRGELRRAHLKQP